MSFTLLDVQQSYERIKNYIVNTPLKESCFLGNNTRRYFYKLENLQPILSCKIRGAISKITTLSQQEREAGIAAISSGNHGIAVSYAASIFKIKKVVIIISELTPKVKVDKIRQYGAEIVFLGRSFDETHTLGKQYIREHNFTEIDSYDYDPKVYAGQGTIGLEILKQNSQIDTIVVPIGGGALISGIAVAAKSINPNIRIIGVQTETCPAMISSIQDNVQYAKYPTHGNSVCDALVGGVGKLSFSIVKSHVDDIVETRELTIMDAIRYMYIKEGYVIEGASATTIAAVMDYADRIGGKNIALVISGGNLDEKIFDTIK